MSFKKQAVACIGGRLKALALTKLKVETANRQSSNRVRAYRTHPTRWF